MDAPPPEDRPKRVVWPFVRVGGAVVLVAAVVFLVLFLIVVFHGYHSIR